jgi:hypothetical protein
MWMKASWVSLVIACAAACNYADAGGDQGTAKASTKGAKKTAPTAESCEARDALAQRHLKAFDDLDYNVFSNQKWARLSDSHSTDIAVYWPDGRKTTGMDPHVKDLEAMFVYAPDTRIKEHPIKVADGEWTAVMGIMEGTFSKPMPMPDGSEVKPTGKKFKLNMVTLGHWNKDGVMDQEYLFWDNQAFMDQIGLGKNKKK